MQGMDFAVDPNGDGDPSDHVDIVNMSLGSNYGQPFDDDLSTAVDTATTVGVLTVAAAGNGSDKPYIAGTPAGANSAISVAQTAVPSDKLHQMHINAPVVANPNRLAIFQPWSAPLTTVISGPVTYAQAGNLNGCNPFTVPLSGIVLVDRGICAISIKVSNVAAAGGSLAVVAMVDGSQVTQFAFGGGNPSIPGFNISQVDGNAIRVGGDVTFDPANAINLVGSMVGTSSRGPSSLDNRLKPEIGAPGGSVSAEHGQGTGRTAFGGTSGATPMIAGSAALLKQFNRIIGEYDDPATLKQTLLMSAETNILAPSVPGGLIPDVAAPVSRIGAGEVRVDRSLAITSSANPLDTQNYTGGISFGFIDADKPMQTITRDLLVGNRSHQAKTYTITPTARYQDDVDTGAVSLNVPSSVSIGAGRYKTIKVRLAVDGTKLRNNLMNSGSAGANPGTLTTNEYDGYLTFQSGNEKWSLPWHALPRKDARVTSKVSEFNFVEDAGTGVGVQSFTLQNKGVGVAQNDTYTAVAKGPDLPSGDRGLGAPTPDIRVFAVNTVIGLPTTLCSSGWAWEFAFNSWERQRNLQGVSYDVFLDIDRDGVFDYDVFNFDNSLSGSRTDGRQVTFAFNQHTGIGTAVFLAEHSTNTANTVLRICGNQVGLTAADVLTRNVDVIVTSSDTFFGGPGDQLDQVTITPFGEGVVGLAPDIAAGGSATLDAFNFGTFPGNTPELGLMVITNGDRGATSRGGATEATEAVLIGLPGTDLDLF
jgi:hypothetical protein